MKLVSKDGVCVPANEKVSLINTTGKTIIVDGKSVGPDEPYIYEGPDRATLEYMKENNVTTLGVHFSKDPEFINRVRQVHNMTMKEYMEANGYDEKTSVAEFDKKLSDVNLHKNPERKQGNKFQSGGRNTAGS